PSVLSWPAAAWSCCWPAPSGCSAGSGSEGGAMRPLRVGLTGGIGSGKSTVSAALARRGTCIIDTDAIARDLTARGGAALTAIAATFGTDMLDATGALDRARMRAEV